MARVQSTGLAPAGETFSAEGHLEMIHNGGGASTDGQGHRLG